MFCHSHFAKQYGLPYQQLLLAGPDVLVSIVGIQNKGTNQPVLGCVAQLIKALESARGNGTSMISLIMPPKDQVID
jgi:hypothetical protein